MTQLVTNSAKSSNLGTQLNTGMNRTTAYGFQWSPGGDHSNKPSNSTNTLFEESTVQKLETSYLSSTQAKTSSSKNKNNQAFVNQKASANDDQFIAPTGPGGASLPKQVVFVDAGTLGMDKYGAYNADAGGTLLLDRRLLNQPEQLKSTYSQGVSQHINQSSAKPASESIAATEIQQPEVTPPTGSMRRSKGGGEGGECGAGDGGGTGSGGTGSGGEGGSCGTGATGGGTGGGGDTNGGAGAAGAAGLGGECSANAAAGENDGDNDANSGTASANQCTAGSETTTAESADESAKLAQACSTLGINLGPTYAAQTCVNDDDTTTVTGCVGIGVSVAFASFSVEYCEPETVPSAPAIAPEDLQQDYSWNVGTGSTGNTASGTSAASGMGSECSANASVGDGDNDGENDNAAASQCGLDSEVSTDESAEISGLCVTVGFDLGPTYSVQTCTNSDETISAQTCAGIGVSVAFADASEDYCETVSVPKPTAAEREEREDDFRRNVFNPVVVGP